MFPLDSMKVELAAQHCTLRMSALFPYLQCDRNNLPEFLTQLQPLFICPKVHSFPCRAVSQRITNASRCEGLR